MKTSHILIVLGIIIISSVIFVIFYDFSFEKNDNIPENSQYCTTELYVKTKEKMDRKLFELIVRDEIAKFGAIYDITDRYVLLTDMGENRTRISLDGLWSLDYDRPNLIESLTDLEFVEEVEEYRGVYLAVECQ